MKRLLLLTAIPCCLLGCATGTATTDALRQDQSAARTACSQWPQAVAVSRLKQAWEACKVGGSAQVWVPVGAIMMPVSTTNGMSVGVEDSSDKTAVVLRAKNGNVLALADFRPGTDANCKTVVTTRGWNTFWAGFAENTPQWLADPTSKLPNCNP